MTLRTGGKANLHQGAIGAGVDISSGLRTYAVSGNENVEEHPDTGNPVAGFAIPQWDRLLNIAASCYELTGLGYQGVDLLMDRELGPLILELNARPGLNIQIANRAGLLKRLRQVEARITELTDIQQCIDLVKQSFSVIKQKKVLTEPV